MAGNLPIKRLSLIVMIGFYGFAGFNHFLNPQFYLPLIPDYLPFHHFINVVSGIVEITFAAALIFSTTRKIAAWGIILMLLAFVPSHIFFIVEGNCLGELCVPAWVGWGRLIVIHPLLILWAYWHAR